MKKLFFVFITFVIIGLTPTVAFANGGIVNNVPFLNENGDEEHRFGVTSLIPPTPGNPLPNTLTSGWFVVQGNVTYANRVTVQGNINLILANGAHLNATQGINVSEGNTITIFAQSTADNAGRLTATGGRAQSGIGGGEMQTGGNITINGGIIVASNYIFAAGIGGGYEGDGGNIIINGGVITATGGHSNAGAGIGSGPFGEGGNITINGGVITATGGLYGAGIGGGDSASGGNITINGGIITAIGNVHGAGIGDGGGSREGVNITINGGDITAIGGNNGAGIGGGTLGHGGNITINGGSVEAIASSSGNAVAIGRGSNGTDGTVRISGTYHFITNTSSNPAVAATRQIGTETFSGTAVTHIPLSNGRAINTLRYISLETLTAPQPRIAVVSGRYDLVCTVLARNGVAFSVLPVANFAARSGNYDIIFVACNAHPAPAAVRQFVSRGGVLYVSDLSADMLAQAFTNHVRFALITRHDFNAQIVNTGLAAQLGGASHMGVVGLWARIATRVPGNATIYLRHPANGHPVAFSFPYGQGRVLFTSFHNSEQATATIDEFLRYVVLRLSHNSIVDNMNTLAAAYGYSFEGAVFGTLMPQESSNVFSHTPAIGNDFRLMLDPSMGRFTIQLVDPLGRVFTNEGIGIATPSENVLPQAFATSFDLRLDDSFNLEENVKTHCCISLEERRAYDAHLPWLESIIINPEDLEDLIVELSQPVNATSFAEFNASNMTVVSLGSQGISVSNPIPGEWRFVVTSSNRFDNAAFVVGIAEKPTPPISSWDDLRREINSVGYGESRTISIGADFSAPTGVIGGTITIPSGRDITLVSNNLNIMRTLTQRNRSQRHFIVSGNLILDNNITLCGESADTESGGVSVRDGTLTMRNGSVIENCRAAVGGAVALHGSTFNMHGGIIRNNRASLGGGVDIFGNSRMNMSGGTITGNVATIYGGGVWVIGTVANGLGLSMTGGAITNNIATHSGGGIYSNGGNPANVSISPGAIVTGNTPDNTNIILARGLNTGFNDDCIYAVMEYRQEILRRHKDALSEYDYDTVPAAAEDEYLSYSPELFYPLD